LRGSGLQLWKKQPGFGRCGRICSRRISCAVFLHVRWTHWFGFFNHPGYKQCRVKLGDLPRIKFPRSVIGALAAWHFWGLCQRVTSVSRHSQGALVCFPVLRLLVLIVRTSIPLSSGLHNLGRKSNWPTARSFGTPRLPRQGLTLVMVVRDEKPRQGQLCNGGALVGRRDGWVKPLPCPYDGPAVEVDKPSVNQCLGLLNTYNRPGR